MYDYGVNKDVGNLPRLRERMSAIIDHYHDVQQDVLETFIDRGQLRKVAEPTIFPSGRKANTRSQARSPATIGRHVCISAFAMIWMRSYEQSASILLGEPPPQTRTKFSLRQL